MTTDPRLQGYSIDRLKCMEMKAGTFFLFDEDIYVFIGKNPRSYTWEGHKINSPHYVLDFTDEAVREGIRAFQKHIWKDQLKGKEL